MLSAGSIDQQRPRLTVPSHGSSSAASGVGETRDRNPFIGPPAVRAELVTYAAVERLHEREPGSMNAIPVREKRHQSRSAADVISGSLSQRTSSGRRPCSETIRSSTSTTLSASIRRLASIASASRVNSSTT